MATKRESLEAALAKTEAGLALAAFNAAKVDGNRDEANAKLEKERAHCRQIHNALVKLDHSNETIITHSRKRIDAQIEKLAEVSKIAAAASHSRDRPVEHAVRDENKTSQDKSRQRRRMDRISISGPEKQSSRSVPHESRLILRQAIGLLALILAYLNYYFIVVKFQISMLPSVFS